MASAQISNQSVRSRSVSVRLLSRILIFSFFVSFFATGLQLFFDYQKDVGFVEEQFAQIENSYLESIAYNLWDLDQNATATNLRGILTLRDIKYLRIVHSDGIVYMEAGNPAVSRTISHTFPITMDQRGIIGILEVTATMSGVYSRLLDRLLIILATQTGKTFVVSTFILFLIQFMIARHLRSLGDYAKSLDLNRLQEPLVLSRKRAGNELPDELDLVVSAINEMRLTLQKSSDDMAIKARMEGELRAAAAVQNEYLPKKSPIILGYELASLFLPAREMSGDYFDFIEIDDEFIGMVVADASDKGMAATLHANTARVLLKDKTDLHKDPIALFKALNKSLSKEFAENRFLTMGYLLLNTKTARITCVNAGHEPFVHIVSKSGATVFVKPQGYPFSRSHLEYFDSRIQTISFSINPGDLIILYSDGLTDTVNNQGEMYGETKLYSLLQESLALSAENVVKKIRKEISLFQGNADQNDDITMIALRRI
ncbi:SpoIIE family protein phosphatase [bacterium]|nr:SpoIIE family protein phosphatase [bacterium]